MKTTKILTTITLIFFCGLFANGQYRPSPKKIKIKGDYLHKSTKTVFPELLDNYSRQEIYSFDKKNNNIGVVYNNKQDDKKTTISIYIYPAKDGAEGRLRNEYLSTMQSIANFTKNGLNATQFAVKYQGDKFICNGFKSISKTDLSENNELILYECGTWFFKLRLTTNELDSTQIAKIEKLILEKFDPSKLTALKPLNPKADVYFSKSAFRDSTLLGSAMGSAFKKIEWALENVKENERASGFPDLYLNLHVESLKEFTKFEKEHNYFKSESTKQYLAELNSIISAGFLSEFVMEQFGMIMIFPNDITLNFEGFDKWKKSNNLTIDLNKHFYLLSYSQK